MRPRRGEGEYCIVLSRSLSHVLTCACVGLHEMLSSGNDKTSNAIL